jgi:hypothetical protein
MSINEKQTGAEDYNKNYELFGKNFQQQMLELLKSDLDSIAANTDSVYEPEKKITLSFFTEPVTVDLKERQMFLGNKILDTFTSSIILHYLLTAGNMPLSGKWITYRELPDGMFYGNTIPAVIAPVAVKFELDFKGFLEKVIMLGGKASPEFKNGAIIYPFKRFPVLFILEEKDDEFDASVTVFFDRNSPGYMRSDIIKTLLVYTVKKITG